MRFANLETVSDLPLQRGIGHSEFGALLPEFANILILLEADIEQNQKMRWLDATNRFMDGKHDLLEHGLDGLHVGGCRGLGRAALGEKVGKGHGEGAEGNECKARMRSTQKAPPLVMLGYSRQHALPGITWLQFLLFLGFLSPSCHPHKRAQCRGDMPGP